MRLSMPHPIDNNVITHPAEIAYEKVLAFSGASLKRDAVDERIVDNVRQGSFTFQGSNGSTLGIIDTQSDVGGWPELSSTDAPLHTSDDGIPDEWKVAHHLDPAKAQANGRDLSTGYDNIEVYINSLVKDITENQK
jgi:hypothetical protein